MEIRVITLSENTAGHGCIAEWGLSMLIEVDGKRILMDTGGGFSAAYNARLLGVDFDTIDTIVLSHGHHDHTGGLVEVLRTRKKPINIVAHPDIWIGKYSSSDSKVQYAGMPYNRELLEGMGATFTLSKKPVPINEHITTSGEVPMLSGYETIDSNLLAKKGDDFGPDPLLDDMAMFIKTDKGLVIFLGCAHHGMINTIRHAQKVTGIEQVYAVVGGTHLFNSSPERITRTIVDLQSIGIKKIGVSHCTGFTASSRLAAVFPDAFFLNNAGSRFTI